MRRKSLFCQTLAFDPGVFELGCQSRRQKVIGGLAAAVAAAAAEVEAGDPPFARSSQLSGAEVQLACLPSSLPADIYFSEADLQVAASAADRACHSLGASQSW